MIYHNVEESVRLIELVAKKGIVKLPPVFTEKSVGAQATINIRALIQAVECYLKGYKSLKDLPEVYVRRGGFPNNLTARHMRRVHNWINVLSFAYRAALVDSYRNMPTAEAVEKVYQAIDGLNFVVRSKNDPYSYKPLRYADDIVKRRWIAQELKQRKLGSITYGAVLSDDEWVLYGLKGQSRKHADSYVKYVVDMMTLADELDKAGESVLANEIDSKLNTLNASAEELVKLVKS